MQSFSKKLICDTETPVSIFTKLAQTHAYAFLLESAEPHEKVGRYSVIGFDAEKLFVFPAGGSTNPLEILKKAFRDFQYETNQKLPRLQAPLVGYFSYETARHFENLDLPLQHEIPEGIFFLPKNLLLFDHFNRTLTAIAYSEKDLKKLIAKIEKLKNLPGPSPLALGNIKIQSKAPGRIKNKKFENLVTSAKKNICSGDVVQIVLSQNFQAQTNTPPFDLYRRLRILSPSPYMYYLQYPDFSIIGSSPETLVRTEGEDIVIRPIAGTRRRGKTPKEDFQLEEDLKQDIKEQAEHMMLVDLGRNDIGRVAEPGSVKVTRLMAVEKYSHVMHLVSEVRGKRKTRGQSGAELFKIFRAAFPAGTLTGAPKIRAMELIAEFEKAPRGIYGGAVGYFDLSGNMDFAIAIRTMLYQNGIVNLRAGAGIVYDSIPTHEHQECLNKAQGPLTSFSS